MFVRVFLLLSRGLAAASRVAARGQPKRASDDAFQGTNRQRRMPRSRTVRARDGRGVNAHLPYMEPRLEKSQSRTDRTYCRAIPRSHLKPTLFAEGQR